MTFAILCEQSGRVRDALRAAGYHAVSFDMEPSDTPGPHIQGDIMDYEEYILLFDAIIAFPLKINIGADSGNNRLPEPSKEKLETFIRLLKEHHLNVFLKPNLKRILGY